jgi:transcription elongation GreA/GreB family factor
VESESSATDGSTVESTEIGVGTSVTVLFSNENKRPYRLQLVDGESDLLNGDISITSRIGMQLLEVREEDEIQLDWGGCLRTCTVQSIQFPESADV